jgi:phenylacetate-CoA ligase
MFSNYFRRSVFSIVDGIRRYHTIKSLKDLKKSQWLPGTEIKKIQWEKLEKLLRYSNNNVPYYQNLFKNLRINVEDGISLENFQKIPPIDKGIITKNKEELRSAEYKSTDLLLDTTSGSTGKKFEFYRDKIGPKRDKYYRDSILLRNTEWTDVNPFDKKAQLWGSQMDISNVKKIQGKLFNFIFPTMLLSSYEMTKEMMNLYVNKINKYKPKSIIGYASALYLFAQHLEMNNITIPGIKGIICSAESLFQQQREIIEKNFSCKVFNRYGCREFGLIAQECKEHNGLHINDEHTFIEVLDKDGNNCKPGELGEIVVTDLDNYGFPFIRYKIGDIGILTDRKCNCGRGLSLFEKIEGRVFDIIVGTNGNHLTGTFWTILLRNYIKGVIQFQIIQERYGEININLKVDKTFTEKEKNKLLKRVHEKCGEEMKINIQLVKEISLTESGKYRFIISKIKPFK